MADALVLAETLGADEYDYLTRNGWRLTNGMLVKSPHA
jgi:hypothetical protein